MITLLIITSLLIQGCEKHEPVNNENPGRILKDAGIDTLVINFGESIYGEEKAEWLKFNRLLEESRCPEKANCFWEGNAKIELQYFNGFNQHLILLNTHERFTRDTVAGELYFKLIDVVPYPHLDSIYQEADYRAKILLSELKSLPGVVADVDATLLDYSNLDGCGWVLEPENGDLLEPVNLPENIDYYHGQRLRVTYIPANEMASICMVGPMVNILKAEPLSCNGYSMLALDEDPFSMPHDRVEISKAWFEEQILNIIVSYSGGCAKHDFELKQQPFFCGTPPLPEPEFFLLHHAHNDPCEAYITDTLCFNLKKLEKTYPEGTGMRLYTPDKKFKRTIDFIP